MDKDEFQAWKDSPATQWVLARLSEIHQRVEQGVRDRLFLSTGLPSQEWQSLQAQAACDRGYVSALKEVIELEHQDIGEPERNSAE